LDVHKRFVEAHAITPEGAETRRFGTMLEELSTLVDWLRSLAIVEVAMESTGVYWKPVYNLLEAAGMQPVVANAHHVKAIPGRKTDAKDAEWIAQLHQHGLLPTSFIPDRQQRELRELTRYRRSLIQERSREAARIQKVLEGANIKLASVASNPLGVSGRAILRQMVAGVTDSQQLAALARGRLQRKHEALASALRGLIGPHQRLLLEEQLNHLEELDTRIARLSEEIEQRLGPFAKTLEAMDRVPGVGLRTAQDVLAETGTDMSRFPSASHLASWAKLCPGNHQTGGKRKSGRRPPGNKWLESALVEAAKAARNKKNCYLSAQYHHLARRRGSRRATIAVAHSLLTILYYVIRDGCEYRDLGPSYYDERRRDALQRNLVTRLTKLGYEVTVRDQREAA
jgi:transposase